MSRDGCLGVVFAVMAACVAWLLLALASLLLIGALTGWWW